MTNRLDLIDTALLRPGRFEIQIEISLPDEKGRKDIFDSYQKLTENGILSSDVNFDELSTLTKISLGQKLKGYVIQLSHMPFRVILKGCISTN